MANVFKPKRSSTASSVPTTSDLIDGELAVNSADRKIYLRDGGTIVEIANADTGLLSNVIDDTTPQLGGNLDLNGNDITGIGSVSITGIITATSFTGDGSNLTNITASQVGSIADIVEDPTPQLGGNLDVNGNDITGTGNVNLTGVVTATSFTGNLTGTATTATNLADAANITTGTISSDRLTGSYGIDITGTATTATNLSDAANITTGTISGDRLTGSYDIDITGTATTATNLADAANITTGTISSDRLTGSYDIDITGTATTATNLADAANITTGTISDDRLPATISSDITGNAATATALETARNFEITGDVVASVVSFDGTGNVSLAATIQPNSVELSTDTTGDYVQSVSGTANEIEVTSGTGEGSTPTIGFVANPTIGGNVTIGQDLTVTRDLQVTRNLNVDGTVTIGGTSATIFAETLKVTDPDLILGVRTDAGGNDIANDTTANHGGIAIASTEGSPLVTLVNPGAGETLPATYKKIMWFKTSSFTGLSTDAWISNYAFGVGTTSMSAGTKFAVGNVEVDFDDITAVRNINSSGVITATTFSGSGASLTSIPNSALDNSSVSYGGISLSLGGSDATPAFDLSDATNYPFTSLTGITTEILGDTTPQLGGDLDLNNSDITGTGNVNITGTITATSFSGSGASLTSLNASNISSGTISDDRLPATITSNITGDLTGNADTATTSTNVTVADESTDTTCFPLFTTAATGDLPPKSGSNLTFNSSNGTLTATTFSGSGASLTSIPNTALDNSTVSYGGIQLSLGGSDATPAFDLSDAINYPYTSLTGITTEIVGDTTPQLGGNLDLNSNDITGTGDVNITGIITATSFSGSGASLTSLNASNISSGTISDDRLPATITSDITGDVTGNADSATTSTNVTVADESTDTTCFPLFVTAATGDLPPKSGSNLTFNSSNGTLTATTFSGSGASLTSLNASNISSGTISDDRLPATITSNITGDVTGNADTATTSTNVTVADESTDTTCFPLFTTAATGNLPPKSGSNLTFNSANGTLTATAFAGDGSSLTGISVSADVVTDTTPQLGGNLDLNSNDITGTGNVNITGIITATSFSGGGGSLTSLNASNISSGTISDDRLPATITSNITGDLTGNADTATTSTNVTVADESTDTTCFPLFTTAATGNLAPKSGTNLTFNSSNGTLTATEFSGGGGSLTSLNASNISSGTISDDRLPATITSNITGDVTGNADTATTSTNVTVADESTDTACNVLFVTAATGNLPPKSGTNLTFNSSNGTLTATTFSGSGASLTSLNASNISSGTISDDRLPATITSDITGDLTGNADTATTSTNVTVADESTDTTCFPLFTTAATGNLPPKSGSNLTFNSSNGTLTATEFSGGGSNLTGLTGASAATYGDASNVAQIVVDANGRITGITEVAISGGGSFNVVDDTTPQLGGNLDVNGNDITGTGNVNLTGIITATSFVGGGSGLTGITASQVGALADIVEDTTPQLGGDLDLNNSDITGTGNVNITGTITASGDIQTDGAFRAESSNSTERFEIEYNETTDSLDFSYFAS